MESKKSTQNLTVLRHLNQELEKVGLRPSLKIDDALAKLKRHNLLHESDFDVEENKVNLSHEVVFPFPLNEYLKAYNPCRKSYIDKRINEYCREKGIDKSAYQAFIIFSPRPLNIQYNSLKEKNIFLTKSELQRRKLTLENLLDLMIDKYYHENKMFLGIQYRTPFGIRVKQFLVENHEGIKYALRIYKKIGFNGKIYNKNAIAFVPSRSREKIVHQVRYYNLPVERKTNPYYDWLKFYVESTVENKAYNEIRDKSATLRIITAIETAGFIKIVNEMSRKKDRITLSPIFIPSPDLAKLIENTSKLIVYDKAIEQYRFANTAERELIVATNILIDPGKYRIITDFRKNNLNFYQEFLN